MRPGDFIGPRAVSDNIEWIYHSPPNNPAIKTIAPIAKPIMPIISPAVAIP